MKYMTIIIGLLIAFSNSPKKEADLIITNANVPGSDNVIIENCCIVIEKGKIAAVGDLKTILKQYDAKKFYDAKSAYVYPGFNDAHCHFFGYAFNLAQYVDLKDAGSIDEIIEILKEYDKKYSPEFLCGCGWDQNKWHIKEMPDWSKLNAEFPDKPVFLLRVDGHAALCNKKSFELADLTEQSVVAGGEVKLINGDPTGLLIDNAIELVSVIIPEPGISQMSMALLQAQDTCLKYGVTSLTDAGLGKNEIKLINSLQKAGKLKIRINAMLNPSDDNFDFLKNKFSETELLKVVSVKLYADGALGSRGACLLEEYSDDPGNKGLMVTDYEYLRKICKYAYENNLQVCTHCIGDSANRIMLDIYSEFLQPGNDRRWRIEHAQVVNDDDIGKFSQYSVIPSVQSTHATSDMYWAGIRLGTQRIKDAYRTKELLEQNGWLPNGTDFPVENINPLETFYASVFREDKSGFPDGGFLPDKKLSREQALMSITYWPAKACFDEKVKGKIEPGMYADFVFMDRNILDCKKEDILKSKILSVWINGNQVSAIY